MGDLTEQDREALVEQFYRSKFGEQGYFGRPECEQIADAVAPAVEAIVARHRAEAWDEGRWAEREYMKQVMAYHHWSNISAGPPVDPPNPHLDRAAQVGASGG